ncbi:sensor domain-containing diguanylate cyclase [Bradyrhizobium sp. LHD-71]|uniref:sensor domain-containing diguanylate cyclase n=1 Tax=Bradyrhizobium sp. LHD-71 TaxID=3072141 RepID=UPI00280D9EAC|nr:sensor domain-containing diguanylate cyclase [Bradyrhizobium sp. LHD-71]MDQ8730969.1 sensor domain-containing diguanylate cyclase [Bradyrhizobium sp. LHD-71]
MFRLRDEEVPALLRPMGAWRPAVGWGRAPFAILLICLCFCGICGWIILDARQAAWKHAGIVGSTVVAALAADLARNIETLDLSILGAMENLKLRGIETLPPQYRQRLLFDRSVAARHVSAILVIKEDGQIRYDSRMADPLKADLSDRDYFKIHKNNDAVGLFIAKPIISRITGVALIPFSRRLAKPDGSFGGVVVGSMRLDYFEKTFGAIALGPGATVTLARRDGIVLVRSPPDSEFIERDKNPDQLIDMFSESPVGQFETTSVTDGTRKLFNYSQVGQLPLVVATGQSFKDIFAQWWRQASAIGALIAALVASTIALVASLNRNLRLRERAEAELAALATTDALTGLANRRSFNDALDLHWRAAARNASPVSLLMIDSDYFKIYNDTFGHQAGDKLLMQMGLAISASLKRPGDLGARYGGDEFAVLLPGSFVEGAAAVAQKIRQTYVSACHVDGISARYSRLSIGVASLVPGEGTQMRDLIAAADEALYRAKELGRNRTELQAKTVTPETSLARAKT